MHSSKKYEPLQFFEYERVTYRGKWKNDCFSKAHFQAFESYYLENPNTPYFDLIPNGVRFKQYVGVIQIGKTTIEVLPKADKENNRTIWHGVLLDMLKTCHLLTAKNTGTAQLRLKSNSLLHLYFELFLKELDELIKRGLIKRYRRESGQSRSLKGPLQFAQHISQNLTHKEKFFIDYTVYDKNHLIHQIFKETLRVIGLFASEVVVLDKLNRIKKLLPTNDTISVKEAHFQKIPVSRKLAPYQSALLMSQLILLNYRPDIRSGNRDLIAILFDMNRLWEEFVLQSLKKEAKSNFIIKGQRKKVFWNNSKYIKPDIVIESRENGKIYIIDTKWKIVNDGRPGDDDLKQMYAYNYRWDCNSSMLLYPSTSGQNVVKGEYFISSDSKKHSCQLTFAQVLDGHKLNRNIAKEILESFCH